MTQPSKAFWEPISIIALLLLILLISICHLQGWLKRGKSGAAQPAPERTSNREKSPKPSKQPSAEPATPGATDAEAEVGQPSAGSTPIPTPTTVTEGGKMTRVLTEEETIEHQPAYRQTIETADGAIQINLNGLGLGQVEMNDRRSETAPPSPVSSEDSFHSFMPRRRGGDDNSDSSDSDLGPSPGGNPPAQGRPPSPYPSAEGVQVNAVDTVPPLQSAAPGKPTFPFSGTTVAETFQNLERDGQFGPGEGQRVRRMDSISLSPVAFMDRDNGNTHAEVNRLTLDDDPLDPDTILAELTRSRSFDTLSPLAARSGKSGTGRSASMIDDLKAEAGRETFLELIDPKDAEKAKAKREKVRQNKDKAPADSHGDTVEAANTRPKATEVVYNSEESASFEEETVVVTKDSRDTPSESVREQVTQKKRGGTERSPTKEGTKKDKKDNKQKEAVQGKSDQLPDELKTEISAINKQLEDVRAARKAEKKKARKAAKEAARQAIEQYARAKADTARLGSESSASSEEETTSESSTDESASKGEAGASMEKSSAKKSVSGSETKKDATASKSDADPKNKKRRKKKKKNPGAANPQGDESSSYETETDSTRSSDSDATKQKRAARRGVKPPRSKEGDQGRGRATSRHQRDGDRQRTSRDSSRPRGRGDDRASDTEIDDRGRDREPRRSIGTRQRSQASRRTRTRQPAGQGDDDPEDQYDEEVPPGQQTSRAPPARRTRQTTQIARSEQEITPDFDRPAAARPDRDRVLRNAPLQNDYDSEVRDDQVSGRDPAYDPSPAEEEAIKRNRWARETGNRVDPQDAAVESSLRKRQRSLQERASKARAKYGKSTDPNEARSDPENEEVDKDPALKAEEDEKSGQTAEQKEKRAARAARVARDWKGKAHERGEGKNADQPSTTEVPPDENAKTEQDNSQSETKEAIEVAAETKTEDVSKADDLETHVGEVMRREVKTEIRRNRAFANSTGSRPRLAETTGPSDPTPPVEINALDTTTAPAAASETREAVVEAANIGTESRASVPETRTEDISEDSSGVTVREGSQPTRHEVPDPIADSMPPPEYTPGDNPDASFYPYEQEEEATVATSAFREDKPGGRRAGGSNGGSGGGSSGGSSGGGESGGSDSSRPSGSGRDSPGHAADGPSGTPGDRPSDRSSNHPSRTSRGSQPSTPVDSVPVPGLAQAMRAMDTRSGRRADAAHIVRTDTGAERSSQSEHPDRDGQPVTMGGDSDYDGRTREAEPTPQDDDRNAGAKLEDHPETPEQKAERLKEKQGINLAVEASWSFDALDDPKHPDQEQAKAATKSPVRSRETNSPSPPRSPDLDTSEKDQEVRAKAKAAWVEKDKEYRKARQERAREQAASAAQVIAEEPVEVSAAGLEAISQSVERHGKGSSESHSVDRREDVGDEADRTPRGDSPSGKTNRRLSSSKSGSTIDVEQPGVDKDDAETFPEVTKQPKEKLAERYPEIEARAESSSRADSPLSRSDVKTASSMQSSAGGEKAKAETERSEAQHAEARASDTTPVQARQGQATSAEERGDAPPQATEQEGQDEETLTPAEAVRRAFAKREAEKKAQKSGEMAKNPGSAGYNEESDEKAERKTDSDARSKQEDKTRRVSAVDRLGKDETPERQEARQGGQDPDLKKQKPSQAETPEGSKQDSAESKKESKDLKNKEGGKKERKRHQAYAADPEDEDADPDEVSPPREATEARGDQPEVDVSEVGGHDQWPHAPDTAKDDLAKTTSKRDEQDERKSDAAPTGEKKRAGRASSVDSQDGPDKFHDAVERQSTADKPDEYHDSVGRQSMSDEEEEFHDTVEKQPQDKKEDSKVSEAELKAKAKREEAAKRKNERVDIAGVNNMANKRHYNKAKPPPKPRKTEPEAPKEPEKMQPGPVEEDEWHGSLLYPLTLARISFQVVKHAKVHTLAMGGMTALVFEGARQLAMFNMFLWQNNAFGKPSKRDGLPTDMTQTHSWLQDWLGGKAMSTSIAFCFLQLWLFVGIGFLGYLYHKIVDRSQGYTATQTDNQAGTATAEKKDAWWKHPFRSFGKGPTWLFNSGPSAAWRGLVATLTILSYGRRPRWSIVYKVFRLWTLFRFLVFLVIVIGLGLLLRQLGSLAYIIMGGQADDSSPFPGPDTDRTATQFRAVASSLRPSQIFYLFNLFFLIAIPLIAFAWYALLHPRSKRPKGEKRSKKGKQKPGDEETGDAQNGVQKLSSTCLFRFLGCSKLDGCGPPWIKYLVWLAVVGGIVGGIVFLVKRNQDEQPVAA